MYMYTSPSGKSYVGQSRRDARHRKNEHKSSASGCHALRHAMQKYGMQAMKYEVLEDDVPVLDLDRRELYWVEFHGTLQPRGYNLIRPGQFRDKLGAVRTHKTRCAEVMGSQSKRQRKRDLWLDDAYCAKQRESRLKVQAEPARVQKRRTLYAARRHGSWVGADNATRAYVAELARRDAVQGARRAIARGTHVRSGRDPLAEVVEMHGDGLEWARFRAENVREAREVMAEYRTGGYAALRARRTQDPPASSRSHPSASEETQG